MPLSWIILGCLEPSSVSNQTYCDCGRSLLDFDQRGPPGFGGHVARPTLSRGSENRDSPFSSSRLRASPPVDTVYLFSFFLPCSEIVRFVFKPVDALSEDYRVWSISTWILGLWMQKWSIFSVPNLVVKCGPPHLFSAVLFTSETSIEHVGSSSVLKYNCGKPSVITWWSVMLSNGTSLQPVKVGTRIVTATQTKTLYIDLLDQPFSLEGLPPFFFFIKEEIKICAMTLVKSYIIS